MLPNLNIVTYKRSISQRWDKLYRNIYNMFLKGDFIHRLDYFQDLMKMNKRITELESKISTELAKLQTGIASHIHAAPYGPTSPPSSPAYTSGFNPTEPVTHKDSFLDKRGNFLYAMGPAVAPLGEGDSLAAQDASLTATLDIGV